MPARTTQQSGNASDPYTWSADGSVSLADGDSITIQAGHSLTWDMDKSAWAGGGTGVAGISVTSSAGTPARLTFPTSGGPYCLPIKAGSAIAGTNAANRGQLYIASQASPVPQATKITIALLGGSPTAQILAQYLDIQVFGTEPQRKYVRTLNAYAAGATAIQCDADVSADPLCPWTPGDLLLIAGTRASSSFLNTATIASIAGTTINIAGGGGPGGGLQYAVNSGSFVVKLNRNVEITSATTGTSRVIDLAGTSLSHTFQCAVRQSGQSRQGYGIAGSGYNIPGAVIAGVVSGFSYGLADVCGSELAGIVANAIYSVTGYNWPAGLPARVSGAIIGGTGWGLNVRGGVLAPGGLIACCAAGAQGDAVDIAGKIIGCVAGVDRTAILRQGCVLGGAGDDANSRDVGSSASVSGPIGVVTGYGASLRSAVQVGTYLYSGDSVPGGHVTLFDAADAAGNPQPGQLAWWSRGGYGKSEPWLQGTHDPGGNYPAAPPAFVHKANFESATARNYVDIPLVCPARRPLRVYVYARKLQNGMAQTPRAQLIDPALAWGDPNEALAAAAMADDTAWQTLPLVYVNPADAPKALVLRVWGANAGGALYWYWTLGATARAGQPLHLGV